MKNAVQAMKYDAVVRSGLMNYNNKQNTPGKEFAEVFCMERLAGSESANLYPSYEIGMQFVKWPSFQSVYYTL
jgi:hypothetical protein